MTNAISKIEISKILFFITSSMLSPFLILIGFNLIVEAAHYSIPKGYIYFALFFTLGVEYINIIFRNVSKKKIKIKE